MKPLQSVVVLLLAVAIGVFAAHWLGAADLNRFGEVILRYGGYDYHSNLPKVALLAVIALLVLWLLWSLIAAPFRAWGRYRRKQGRVRLIDGLQAYEHGQWQRAEKLFDGAAADKEVAAVALAHAVRSAQARADAAASDALLQRLATDDATLHALLRAEQLLERELPVDAINTLDAAAVQPLPPRGLWLRTEALARAGRAHEAYGQLGPLRQSKVLPAEVASELEARLAAQALLEAADVNALAAQWETTPKALRPTADVVGAYATRAVALSWDEPALLALEQALDNRWDDTLVELYGRLPAERLATRAANLQRWRSTHDASAALRLAQGRIALAQEQWDAADGFLHEAIAAGAGAPAWEALGLAFLQRGEPALAAQCLANALRLQRGEDSLALVHAAAAAGEPAPRATVEEHGTGDVPPVYNANEDRDAFGNPRLP
ncbi:heme biosynthesis HemY N-terminal domain-containing protein [Stenotrophomonas sp. 24(2023)]|uniref:heme biosynthesis protein HemY n=1 Tax=Stenotrophomonas sp. 24(2023) TaxID=3068324 RepID=UPI0027DEC13F|nr:heme biosynthesis HemY N-terminal domain-containing protein [Stenotrophomonas sp. 24(2023)]WMJ71208.1 heme biosynthesis HemY N-terminal domain-containing protein [Stenotrophomonas sp. 24(2023)]